jgi:MoxR-like ATPase
MEKDLTQAAGSLREALSDAGRGLVDREALVELVALAAVASEHALVIGPPGTAKSEAVRRVARATGGDYFEYLLGRFTEPSELFGPVDLRKLRDGIVETETTGMLPEAQIAFLDEIFQGSTAILNTLLGILNERMFRRGHTRMGCPLRICVGASNELPEDESLAAFADRFLVRVFVDPIPDMLLEDLLEGGWSVSRFSPNYKASMTDVDVLAELARTADVSAVRPLIARAVRVLRSAGVALSDRRIVKVQRLVAAAAALAGRRHPGEADLWPIVFAVPTREQQSMAREALRDVLAPTENATLPAAAEEASAGPIARATRLMKAGRAQLDARPDGNDPELERGWRLRLEGIAREIDAGFSPTNLPQDLADVRRAIVEALAGAST